MEVRVLGAVSVSRDGRIVPIPGRIGPRLLAMLSLDPGRVVSVDRLVTGIWVDDPPATARTQVRNGVSTLRKHVGGRIEFTGGGYRLRMSDTTVDAQRFSDAVRRARRLTADGDAEAAIEELRGGLALWRGTAFAGLTGGSIEAASIRLEESRLSAVEQLMTLELDEGRAAELIDELRHLTSAFPHRQRLTELLMLALHRDDRVPEAVEAYRRLRSRLAADLGIDPGVAVRDLHTAILRGDPGSAAARSAVSTVAVKAGPRSRLPVPAQLPADVVGFVGRDRELAELDALGLGARKPAAVIGGLSGCGKTALALRWAHRHRGEFPDGQLYINLRGFDLAEPVPAYSALERFLTALGYSGSAIPKDLDEATTLFRSIVTDRRLLFVLDNARDADQVRPLLPCGTGSFAMVTSRNTLAGLAAVNDARLLGLSTLSSDDSAQLLTDQLGTERLGTEPDAVGRLARLCGGLPLVLRIAAANLVAEPGVSLTSYVARLEAGNRLDLLAVAGDPSAAVASTFEHSFRALSPDTRQVFMRLGLIPGEDFSDELAGEVAQAPNRARTHLDRLRTAHLLEQHRPGRFRFHDLIRLYAAHEAGRALDARQRFDVAERYVAWHHHRTLTLPLTETMNIVAGFSSLADHPRIWRLAIALQAVVYSGQTPTLSRQIVDAGMRRVRNDGDPRGRSQLTGLLGGWHRMMGDLPTAMSHCRQALSMAAGTDLFTTGLALGNLGAVLIDHGDYREAETVLKRAWEISVVLDTAVWRQATDYFLGVLYGEMSEFEKAFSYLAEAETLTAQEPTTSARIINTLAKARLLINTGELDDAEHLLVAKAGDVHDTPDNRARCMYLSAWGDLSQRRDDTAEARRSFTQMRSVARQFGLSFAEAQAGARLAMVLSQTGRNHAALRLIDRLRDSLSERLGPVITAEVALASAVACNGIGAFESALRHGVRSADMFGRMPSPLKRDRALAEVATSRRGIGD